MTDSQSGSAANWTSQSPSPEPQMQDSCWTPSQNRTLQPLGAPLPSRKREADGSPMCKARWIHGSPAPNSLPLTAGTRRNVESAYQKFLNEVRRMNEDVDQRLEAARQRPRKICSGRYEVGGKIGEGSFGVVFEGIIYSTQKEVAIKFVSIPSFQEEQRSYFAGTTIPRTTTRRVSYV